MARVHVIGSGKITGAQFSVLVVVPCRQHKLLSVCRMRRPDTDIAFINR